MSEPAGLTGAEVRAARFQATKFREGYDQAEVDDLLDRLAAALDDAAAGRPAGLTADDVLAARFQSTKYREGYDQDEVDDFLDEAVRALRGLAGVGGAASRPVTGADLRSALAALPTTRFRRGYAIDQVDSLVTSVAAELDRRSHGVAPQLTADRVPDTRTLGWARPGYQAMAAATLVARATEALR